MANEKKFTEKEVIDLLYKQRKSDAELLKPETNMSGYNAMKRVLNNKLVYTKKNVIQE